jgi:hypothetical protein
LSRIIQAGYLRADERPGVIVAGQEIPVDETVWSFFRDPLSISTLGDKAGVPITAIDGDFDPRKRDRYAEAVLARLRASRPGAILLFLDPDTGLEPSHAAAEHVSRRELRTYWQSLNACDWLVLYQHARRDRHWCEGVCAELSKICDSAAVQIARSTEVGRDVALLFVEKR